MYKALRLIYRLILINFVIVGQGSGKPYSAVVLAAMIVFTLTLPLTFPIILIGSLYRLIKERDLQEAVENSQTLLTVYQETSEFEYRSAATVCTRILDKATSRLKHNVSLDVATFVIRPERIIGIFIIEEQLFALKLEDRSQYIMSCYQQCLEQYPGAELSTDQEQAIKSNLGQDFDEIVAKSGDDLLHGYYLGRDILAAKINIGERRPPKTNPELQEV